MTKSDLKRRSLLAVLGVAVISLPLAAGSIATAKPEEVGLSTERLQRVKETVQQHIESRTVAGAVTLVARRGRSLTSRPTA